MTIKKKKNTCHVQMFSFVLQEIVTALAGKKNIVPVTDNFTWPDPMSLPEDMRSILNFNGIKWVINKALHNKLYILLLYCYILVSTSLHNWKSGLHVVHILIRGYSNFTKTIYFYFFSSPLTQMVPWISGGHDREDPTFSERKPRPTWRSRLERTEKK